MVLGGGSNVVLAPELNCLVVKVESRGIRLVDEGEEAWIIEAQAGEVWHDFVSHCIGQGWKGLENLALIPGTVGAAPVQRSEEQTSELQSTMRSSYAGYGLK